MIELQGIYKKFDNGEYVLKNINLSFPRYGIVVIYGPSGCGKTTLLNVISSLCDFEGDVSFNGKRYSSMTSEDKDLLRNTKIGFIFQDYKLFEYETVKNNIMLALDIKTRDKKAIKERRINDLLQIVDLKNKANEIVTNLSGGEKQRVALARAICNSPGLLLADEPTGNLDSKNSELVMDLMERISKNSLVIMVSHDEELTKKYADQIIYMKDGYIEKVLYNSHNHHVDLLPLPHINAKENKASLPLDFCIRHTANNIKRRKWRTAFVLLTSSLGLLSVGLGAVLSKIISINLYDCYSSIIDANKVIMTPKDKAKNKQEIRSLSYEETSSIVEEYRDYISGTGVFYLNNLDSMFSSSFSFDNGTKYSVLPNYLLSYINEYRSLDNCVTEIYPNQIEELEDDEVILGLTYPTINEICFQLTIKRNAGSLSEYLKENSLYLSIDVFNNQWDYNSTVRLKIKGFIISDSNCILHSNKTWNEYIFEERLNLSTTDYINVNSKNPWDLKKSYYLDFVSNRDKFLTEMKFSKKYKDIICEILTSDYCPNFYKDTSPDQVSRVMLLKSPKNGISGFYNSYIKGLSSDIKSLVYGSSNGYAIYPESLMMGFSKTTYLSNELSYIEDAIDLTAYIRYEESMNVTVPSSVIEGHFAKSNIQGLTFNPTYKLFEGRKPNGYGEIVVSRAIVNRLQLVYPINKWLYLSFPIKEELLPNGYLSRNYRTVPIKVVGISDSLKYEISNAEEWSIMFFQTHLGVSNINLDIGSIGIEINENTEENIINTLNRAFPNFETVSPISSVKDSIKTVCNYIEIILLVLSISSVVISSLLLSICNYLHFVEIKKDIGLIRCIGITKNESSKFIFIHSFVLSFISIVIATAQLIIVSYFTSKSISSIFEMQTSFVFNPLAVFYMVLVAVVISLISSFIIKKKVNLLDPLECLRT